MHSGNTQNSNRGENVIVSNPQLPEERMEENMSVSDTIDGEKKVQDSEMQPWPGEVDVSRETIQSEIPVGYVRQYEAPHVAWNKSSTQIGPQYSQYCLPDFGTLPTNRMCVF